MIFKFIYSTFLSLALVSTLQVRGWASDKLPQEQSDGVKQALAEAKNKASQANRATLDSMNILDGNSLPSDISYNDFIAQHEGYLGSVKGFTDGSSPEAKDLESEEFKYFIAGLESYISNGGQFVDIIEALEILMAEQSQLHTLQSGGFVRTPEILIDMVIALWAGDGRPERSGPWANNALLGKSDHFKTLAKLVFGGPESWRNQGGREGLKNLGQYFRTLKIYNVFAKFLVEHIDALSRDELSRLAKIGVTLARIQSLYGAYITAHPLLINGGWFSELEPVLQKNVFSDYIEVRYYAIASLFSARQTNKLSNYSKELVRLLELSGGVKALGQRSENRMGFGATGGSVYLDANIDPNVAADELLKLWGANPNEDIRQVIEQVTAYSGKPYVNKRKMDMNTATGIVVHYLDRLYLANKAAAQFVLKHLMMLTSSTYHTRTLVLQWVSTDLVLALHEENPHKYSQGEKEMNERIIVYEKLLPTHPTLYLDLVKIRNYMNSHPERFSNRARWKFKARLWKIEKSHGISDDMFTPEQLEVPRYVTDCSDLLTEK